VNISLQVVIEKKWRPTNSLYFRYTWVH